MISQYLDKNNLHHAYLIEGDRNLITEEILKFIEELNIKTHGNPDFLHMEFDSFKIEDARNLKIFSNQKSFSSSLKIFIISANNFLLEAQNSLLKMFEEPAKNTHYFIIIPDVNVLLKTFISRFYLISEQVNIVEGKKEVEKFITMSLGRRIDFIKNLLTEQKEEDEEENETIVLNSTRAKAIKFLNALESVLNDNLSKNNSLKICLEHIFKVREFLNMPGSSTKSLMESVALIVPDLLK